MEVSWNVSRLRLKISMSLDGFVAGPDQSVDNPLGIAGMGLHQWAFPLAAWALDTRSGERLFDGLGDDLRGLEPVRTVAAPKVTHLKFARR